MSAPTLTPSSASASLPSAKVSGPRRKLLKVLVTVANLDSILRIATANALVVLAPFVVVTVCVMKVCLEMAFALVSTTLPMVSGLVQAVPPASTKSGETLALSGANAFAVCATWAVTEAVVVSAMVLGTLERNVRSVILLNAQIASLGRHAKMAVVVTASALIPALAIKASANAINTTVLTTARTAALKIRTRTNCATATVGATKEALELDSAFATTPTSFPTTAASANTVSGVLNARTPASPTLPFLAPATVFATGSTVSVPAMLVMVIVSVPPSALLTSLTKSVLVTVPAALSVSANVTKTFNEVTGKALPATNASIDTGARTARRLVEFGPSLAAALSATITERASERLANATALAITVVNSVKPPSILI